MCDIPFQFKFFSYFSYLYVSIRRIINICCLHKCCCIYFYQEKKGTYIISQWTKSFESFIHANVLGGNIKYRNKNRINWRCMYQRKICLCKIFMNEFFNLQKNGENPAQKLISYFESSYWQDRAYPVLLIIELIKIKNVKKCGM